jgi:hypothetical protein
MAHVCYVLDLAMNLALQIHSFECAAYHELLVLLKNIM